jgi:hypothetical protein
LADVSEPSVGSLFKGINGINGFKPLKMDPTEGSETLANINQTLGITPKSGNS